MSEKSEPDASKLKEILGTISEKVPPLIQAVFGTIFSEEAGRNMGKAAAAFYAELKKGAIPEDQALEMTKDYIRNFTNLSEMFKTAKG